MFFLRNDKVGSFLRSECYAALYSCNDILRKKQHNQDTVAQKHHPTGLQAAGHRGTCSFALCACVVCYYVKCQPRSTFRPTAVRSRCGL